MSKNLEAAGVARKSALKLGAAALLLSLAGAIPDYGLIASIAGFILGIVARRRAKDANSAPANWCAGLAIYLAVLRVVVTLVVAFWLSDLLVSTKPHYVVGPHSLLPPEPAESAKPKP